MMMTHQNYVLIDFQTEIRTDSWRVVDDGVMGGLSAGQFSLNDEGNGLFQGTVSLENNGGFSSVRCNFDAIDISAYTKILLRIKGDEKSYQFRLKPNADDRHSYINQIETTGEWQTIELLLADFYPGFRGRQLPIPNYVPGQLEEIRFLIGNKKAEAFKLEIEKIELR